MDPVPEQTAAPNFYLIGLIGNLGSGKSTVRKMLEQLGARGIDADALAHVVTQRGSPAWRKIVATFGADVLTYNGRIDRRQLGKRVFAETDALQKLEAIVHPAVGALTKEILRDIAAPVVVLEAIKLVEAGMAQWCDALWAVTCDTETQIERVTRTRPLSDADARTRLVAQGSLANKLKLAAVVIDNSGNEAATRTQVAQAWNALRGATGRDKTEWLVGAPRVAPKLPPPIPALRSEDAPTVIMPAPLVAPPPTLEWTPVPAPVEPPTLKPTPPSIEAEPPPTAPPKSAAEFEVRRTRRSDLDALALALAKREGKPQPLAREEALQRFGERGYRIAISEGHIVAFAAWEAENLVATVREVWAESSYIALLVLPKLFALIEEEARGLLCEIVLVFVENSAPLFINEQVRGVGYSIADLNSLHPMWRQIAQDRLKPGERIWAKRLREELITKPV